MTRNRLIALTLAVALAFAGGAGPRHARAMQSHDHPAASAHNHAHHEVGGLHSHAHEAAAPSQFAEGGTHDHAGQQESDQGCCYAWCSSAAVIPAASWLLILASHHERFSAATPFRFAALSAAIDPPPR